jgi:hypothetical protein
MVAFIFANKPAFECRDDRIQPAGVYGRLHLVPGYPRTRNNGAPLCIFIKDNKNIKEKKKINLKYTVELRNNKKITLY